MPSRLKVAVVASLPIMTNESAQSSELMHAMVVAARGCRTENDSSFDRCQRLVCLMERGWEVELDRVTRWRFMAG